MYNIEAHTIVSAIDEVIKEVFIKEDLNFDVFIISSETSYFDDIANEVLVRNSGKCACEIKKISDTVSFDEFFEVTRSALFLVTYQVFLHLALKGDTSFSFTSSRSKKFIFYTEQMFQRHRVDQILNKTIGVALEMLELNKYFIVNSFDRTRLTLYMNRVRNSSIDGSKLVI